MVDLVLLVIASAISGLVAYLGASSIPPGGKRTLISVLGWLGAAASVCIGYRGIESSNTDHSLFQQIAKNTEQLPRPNEPNVTLTPFGYTQPSLAGIKFDTRVENIGNVTARSLVSINDSFVMPLSSDSEHAIFAALTPKARDASLPVQDLYPGPEHLFLQRAFMKMPTDEEKPQITTHQKVDYLAQITSYLDGEGHLQWTELCMYMASAPTAIDTPDLQYCATHNGQTSPPDPNHLSH